MGRVVESAQVGKQEGREAGCILRERGRWTPKATRAGDCIQDVGSNAVDGGGKRTIPSRREMPVRDLEWSGAQEEAEERVRNMFESDEKDQKEENEEEEEGRQVEAKRGIRTGEVSHSLYLHSLSHTQTHTHTHTHTHTRIGPCSLLAAR